MRRIPDTLRAVVVTLAFACIGWMGVVQATTVVVLENPTSRVAHLDLSGPVWTDDSGRLGTLYVDTPAGLCPCGQTCTPPRRPSQSIAAGASRTYSITADAHRIVVGDDGEPCYRTEPSYPGRC